MPIDLFGNSSAPRPNRAARRAAARKSGGTRAKVAKLALGGVAATSGLGLVAIPTAGAAGFVVTNLDDSGEGSLRQAILDANGASGPDVITFDPELAGTILLTTGDLNISDDVVIDGPGAGVITVSGYESSRVFYLYNQLRQIDVTIEGLTIADGSSPHGDGGAVLNSGENLTLDHTVVTGNLSGADGGGIANVGAAAILEVVDSEISGNTAYYDGGGIAGDGAITVTRSTIFDNTAYYYGGGISARGASLTVTDSLVSGNSADSGGGGLYVYDAESLSISGSTISGNSAGGGGGGLYAREVVSLSISDSTISDNQAESEGGGIVFSESDATITNSTISGNTSGSDGGGVHSYLGYLSIADSFISNNVANQGGGLSVSSGTRRFGGPGQLANGAGSSARSRAGGLLAELGRARTEDVPSIYGYSVTAIEDSTISNNVANRDGGGIDVVRGDVRLLGSAVTGNVAGAPESCEYGVTAIYCDSFGAGGGIHLAPYSTAVLFGSTLAENSADLGGGAHVGRSALFGAVLSSIKDNVASGNGGGLSVNEIYSVGVVLSSTVSGNESGGNGGGIGVEGARPGPELTDSPLVSGRSEVLVWNSTVTQNSAAGDGGGLVLPDATTSRYGLSYLNGEIAHSTITGNTAGGQGGGVFAMPGAPLPPSQPIEPTSYVLTLDHTIVAGNAAAGSPEPTLAGVDNDVSGSLEARFSLIGDLGYASVDDLGGNVIGVDALLGPLADNGGPTLTHLPLAGSPVIDAGDPDLGLDETHLLLDTDQRGEDRILNERVDIGAVEVQPTPPPPSPLPFEDCRDFAAVHPVRVLDTRVGGTPVAAGGVRSVTVTGVGGVGGVPVDGVAAVALNVTSTGASAPSFLTVWPTGEVRPPTSSLNTDPGVDVANMVIAKVGAGGQVSIYNNAGATDLAVDVLGWFSSCGEYRALTPIRGIDTRTGGGAIGAGGTRTVPVLGVGGAGGVPATGVEAVVLNVTSTQASASSYLTVYATGVARPSVSNLNTEPGSDVANAVIVPPGADGSVTVYNNAGTGHVVVDIVGYFTADSTYVPVSPARVADTRTNSGAAGPVGSGQSRNVAVAGAGLPAPAGAASVIVNLTSTQASAESFVTAYGTGQALPPTSNLNSEPDVDVANLAIAQVGADGRITLFNNNGTVHLIGDVFGYFPPDVL